METPPRPQAVVKNLPKEKQDAIWDYRFGKPRHTQLQTVKWLRDDAIQTSSGALSYWERSYVVERKMDDNKAATDQMIARGKAEGWIKTAEEEQAIAQCFFNRLAAQGMDAKTWFLMQSINTDKEKVALAREKVEIDRQKVAQDKEKIEILTCEKFLAWFKDKKARDIAESNISTPDKIAQLRQTYFADVAALEQSGEVKLPE
jgi:hypothetical protein